MSCLVTTHTEPVSWSNVVSDCLCGIQRLTEHLGKLRLQSHDWRASVWGRSLTNSQLQMKGTVLVHGNRYQMYSGKLWDTFNDTLSLWATLDWIRRLYCTRFMWGLACLTLTFFVNEWRSAHKRWLSVMPWWWGRGDLWLLEGVT